MAGHNPHQKAYFATRGLEEGLRCIFKTIQSGADWIERAQMRVTCVLVMD